jgi:hypothetical protein
VTSEPEFDQALADLAEQLGCTLEELHSSMQEAGRVDFELAPSEQYELDLRASAQAVDKHRRGAQLSCLPA